MTPPFTVAEPSFALDTRLTVSYAATGAPFAPALYNGAWMPSVDPPGDDPEHEELLQNALSDFLLDEALNEEEVRSVSFWGTCFVMVDDAFVTFVVRCGSALAGIPDYVQARFTARLAYFNHEMPNHRLAELLATHMSEMHVDLAHVTMNLDDVSHIWDIACKLAAARRRTTEPSVESMPSPRLVTD